MFLVFLILQAILIKTINKNENLKEETKNILIKFIVYIITYI